MARRVGRDDRYVNILWRGDLAEVNVEAVREHERLAGGHVGGDFVVIEVALDVVGDQDHDDIRGFGGLGSGADLEAGGLGFHPAFAAGVEADDDVDASIAKVERGGMSLAAAANDG